MRLPALFLLANLSYGLLRAQEINGIVRDDQGKLLANASLILKKGKDSALVKISLSDNNGQYIFSSIPAGSYFITASHVACQPASSAVFTISESGAIQVPPLQLSRSSRELQQAQVTAIRPLVEVRPDKIVLNVESTINATGEDALDLLRKSPGVTVDNNNSISLSGKS